MNDTNQVRLADIKYRMVEAGGTVLMLSDDLPTEGDLVKSDYLSEITRLVGREWTDWHTVPQETRDSFKRVVAARPAQTGCIALTEGLVEDWRWARSSETVTVLSVQARDGRWEPQPGTDGELQIEFDAPECPKSDLETELERIAGLPDLDRLRELNWLAEETAQEFKYRMELIDAACSDAIAECSDEAKAELCYHSPEDITQKIWI